MKIIDISKHDVVDFKQLKSADIDGIIIRCGSGRKGIDPKFIEHINGAIGIGLPIGIYFFSYAYSVGMARAEAEKCLEYIAAYKDSITLPVFFDWEYDSMKNAQNHGVNPGGKLIMQMCNAFMQTISAAGYRTGIYYNQDYVNRGYINPHEIQDKYYRWFARYTTVPQTDCDLWQYTETGKISGVSGNCDISKVINKQIFGTVEKAAEGAAFLAQARKWVGLKRSDGSYQVILDTYNGNKPLPRGYKVKVGDQWCAMFVSACAIAAGVAGIVPIECSCQRQIEGWKEIGCWVEDDAYIPSPDDVIYYDWDDSGSGDDKGWSDHVGIVEACDGKTITVIEGNKGGAVARRTLKVNARYIRGYGVPKFAKAEPKPVKLEKPVQTPVEANKSINVNVDILGGVKMPELKKGTTGKAVKVWQAIVGTAIDGKFGANTEKKTKAFQKAHKLEQDGIVGKKTWKAGLESVG